MAKVTFKICARCQFRVPGRKGACTTCGSTKFSGTVVLELPGPESDTYSGASVASGEPANVSDSRTGYAPPPSVTKAPANRNPYLDSPGFLSLGVTSGDQPQSDLQKTPTSQSRSYSDVTPVTRPVSSLREKFSATQAQPEELKVRWLEEQWDKLRRTLNF